MIGSLLARAKAIGQAAAEQKQTELLEVLETAAPPHVDVVQSSEGVTLKSARLGDDLIENSGIRDVAYLLRGVR